MVSSFQVLRIKVSMHRLPFPHVLHAAPTSDSLRTTPLHFVILSITIFYRLFYLLSRVLKTFTAPSLQLPCCSTASFTSTSFQTSVLAFLNSTVAAKCLASTSRVAPRYVELPFQGKFFGMSQNLAAVAVLQYPWLESKR